MAEKRKRNLRELTRKELVDLAIDEKVSVEPYRVKRVIQPPPPKTPPTPLKLEISANAFTTSNAFQASTNERNDEVAALSSSLQYNPSLNEQSTLRLRFGTGSTRFNEFDALGQDTLSGGATILHVVKDSAIAEWFGAGQFKPSESYLVDFGTTSLFDVGYKGSARILNGLSAKWTLDSIPLGPIPCKGASGATPCHKVGVSVAVAQTYTNFTGGDNFAGTFRIDYAWTPTQHFVFKTGGGVKAASYSEVSNGRDDLTYSVGSSVEWSPNTATTISAAVDYVTRDSSVNVLDNEVFTVKPGITVKMTLN